MSDKPFHHGNLRAVLLDEAETVVRERGIDALSLRDLARQAGVSHGAPRSHFIDRNALLDALAERGFLRLAAEVESAASRSPDDYPRSLRSAASAYVRFAVEESSLFELMFAAKNSSPSDALIAASGRMFGTLTDVIGRGVGVQAFEQRDLERLTLLISATTLGISMFVGVQRITLEQSEELIEDAIGLFVSRRLPDR